jgi:hypothetical protein
MFASVVGTWLPLALIFAITWVVGFVMSTLPWPRPEKRAARPGHRAPVA